eukprot:scaffold132_cov170-Amphora_coffeaeformis.AAC.53
MLPSHWGLAFYQLALGAEPRANDAMDQSMGARNRGTTILPQDAQLWHWYHTPGKSHEDGH